MATWSLALNDWGIWERGSAEYILACKQEVTRGWIKLNETKRRKSEYWHCAVKKSKWGGERGTQATHGKCTLHFSENKPERTRPLCGCRRKYEENGSYISGFEGVDWIHLAHYFVNRVLKFLILYNSNKALTNWASISFPEWQCMIHLFITFNDENSCFMSLQRFITYKRGITWFQFVKIP